MWPSTPAERRHLASRCRTCCLRRFRASRPPQSYFFRGSIPHPIRSLCTLRIRRRRRLRNTRFPAVRYRLTGAGLSPAGSLQLRLTHRNRKFESGFLQRGVACEPEDDIDIPVRRGSTITIRSPSTTSRPDSRGGQPTRRKGTALRRDTPGTSSTPTCGKPIAFLAGLMPRDLNDAHIMADFALCMTTPRG